MELSKVLRDYIKNLLPLCENNDIYDDESDQDFSQEDDEDDDE